MCVHHGCQIGCAVLQRQHGGAFLGLKVIGAAKDQVIGGLAPGEAVQICFERFIAHGIVQRTRDAEHLCVRVDIADAVAYHLDLFAAHL